MKDDERVLPAMPVRSWNPAAVAALLVTVSVLAGCAQEEQVQAPTGGAAHFRDAGTLPVDGTVAAVAHLDADDALDLVVTGPGGVHVLTGRVGVGFEDAGVVPGFRACKPCTAVAVGDVDGSGHADIIAFARDGTLFLALNDGRGAWAPPPPDALPSIVGPARALTLVDVDYDGHLDLAAATGGGVRVAMNDGTGRFGNVTALTDREATAVAFVLADDDMLLDLVVAETRGLRLFLNDAEAPGTFPEARGDALPPVQAARSIVPVDVNNDRRVDLLAATGDGLILLESAGTATYRDVTTEVNATATMAALRVAVAFDVDNDGLEDLLALTESGILVLLRNRADAGFESVRVTEDAPAAALALATGDVDRDGRVDVLVSPAEGAAAVLENAAPGGPGITLRLVGRESNPEGIGASVAAMAQQMTLHRQVGGVASPGVARAPDVNIGLGSTPPENHTLTIRWPSGVVQTGSVACSHVVDRLLVVEESTGPAPWTTC